MRLIIRSTWLRYLLAMSLVIVAAALRVYLGRWTTGWEGAPFTLMLAAVMAASWWLGTGPGIVATFVAAAVCDYFFIEPKYQLLSNPVGSDLRLALFIAEGLFVSWVFQAMRHWSAQTRTAERNLKLIADNTSDVIFAYDMSRQLLYVNGAFESLTGNTINELRENPFMNYVHPDDSPRMQAMFDGLFLGKNFKDIEYRIITHDGEVKWCRASWGPVVDRFGNQIGVQGRETDITEQKRSQSTLKFLADTSAALANSSEVKDTLSQIARAAVGLFADWCIFDLLQEGQARGVAAAHADPIREPWLLEIVRDYPLQLDDSRDYGLARVIRSGQPEILVAVRDSDIAAAAQDARHLKLLHNLAPRSAMTLPLKTRRGTLLGAITFVRSETRRPYNAEDLSFATELAIRIADAIQANLGSGRATTAPPVEAVADTQQPAGA